MEIEVLRIGQRVVRDDRVTTHVALVARSFGAKKIYMNEVNPEIKQTISDINKKWGGNFKIEIISEWKKIIKEKKHSGVKIIHLTMYGQNINNIENKIRNEDKILVIVGAEKVQREVYELADYNPISKDDNIKSYSFEHRVTRSIKDSLLVEESEKNWFVYEAFFSKSGTSCQ